MQPAYAGEVIWGSGNAGTTPALRATICEQASLRSSNSLCLVTTLRMRRIDARWPFFRNRYEIEVRGPDGDLLEHAKTTGATAFLVKKAGVRSTDSWDWKRAADDLFERNSADWVSDPRDPYRT